MPQVAPLVLGLTHKVIERIIESGNRSHLGGAGLCGNLSA